MKSLYCNCLIFDCDVSIWFDVNHVNFIPNKNGWFRNWMKTKWPLFPLCGTFIARTFMHSSLIFLHFYDFICWIPCGRTEKISSYTEQLKKIHHVYTKMRHRTHAQYPSKHTIYPTHLIHNSESISFHIIFVFIIAAALSVWFYDIYFILARCLLLSFEKNTTWRMNYHVNC